MLQVDPLVAGLGLAGALLCELAVARQVFVTEGRLQVAPAAVARLLERRGGRYGRPQIRSGDTPGLPASAVAVLRLMLAEPQPLPVADWLAFLSRDAYERVVERMLADGLVQVTRVGRLSRRKAYPPTDVNVSGWAAARLRIQVERGAGFSLTDRVVIGLCLAAGVHRRAFDGLPVELVAPLAGLRERLPVPLPELLCRLEVAVAAAVVHRP